MKLTIYSMAKRSLDIGAAVIGLALLSPLLALLAVAVWAEDRHSPWFRGQRIGRHHRVFRMLKFRSMRPDAWRSGVNSTAGNDVRITRIGALLRQHKLDELPQLWNVLKGDMSLVGPRPQVPADAALYTNEERRMLTVRPGITDLASIAFSDEAEILRGATDPDLLYNRIIRPWKSRLALTCIAHGSLLNDLVTICLTALALFSRSRALMGVQWMLRRWKTDERLCVAALRISPLMAYPPPGASEIVQGYRSEKHSVEVSNIGMG